MNQLIVPGAIKERISLMKSEPRVIRTKNFAAAAADFILEQARKAINERNEFRIALSGGNTPQPIYGRLVVANFVPKLNAWRLTFTFPLINRARHILFLVGATKNPGLIQRVLDGDRELPAARVDPSAGEVTWMIGE